MESIKISLSGVNVLHKFLCIICALFVLMLPVNTQAEPLAGVNEGVAEVFQSKEGFTSVDIATSAMQAIKGCLNFCIVKICTAIKYEGDYILVPTPAAGVTIPVPIPTIVFTPKWRHNLPEYVVSVYKQPEDHPWKEWGLTVGKAEKITQKGILEVASAAEMLAAGLAPAEVIIGGNNALGQEEGTFTGHDYMFREASVIGHPLVILPEILNSDKAEKPQGNGNGGDHTRSGAAELNGGIAVDCGNGAAGIARERCDFQDNRNKKKGTNNGVAASAALKEITQSDTVSLMQNPAFRDGMGILGVVDSILDVVNTITGPLDQINELTHGLSGFINPGILLQGAEAVVPGFMPTSIMKLSIDKLMCSSPIEPMTPYYSSALDSVLWRGGSRLGAAVVYPEALTYSHDVNLTNIGMSKEKWGPLFPRIGSIYHHNISKASSLFALRALDIVMRPSKTVQTVMPHIKIETPMEKPEGALDPHGLWQPLYPNPEGMCYSSLAHEGIKKATITVNGQKKVLAQRPYTFEAGGTDMEGVYAWSYWGSYECCSSDEGLDMVEIDIPDICL